MTTLEAQTEAAYCLGKDGALGDPRDADVIMAACEIGGGSWRKLSTAEEEEIVAAYDKGAAVFCDKRLEA